MDGFILAGGASSRMGADKATLDLDGETFVERTVRTLAAVCPRVAVVGSADAVFTDGQLLETFPDISRGWESAPIIGLLTALSRSKTGWLVLLACDLPFVTSELIVKLAGYRTDDADAAVPIQSDERPQPLCALYRCETVVPVVNAMIATGDLKMQRLLWRLRTRWVDFEEFRDLAGSQAFFLNVNTPADLASARRLIRADRG